MRRLALFALTVILTAPLFADGEQRFATLGDFPLESGEIIRDCRLGFRTWGRINEQRSNVVVLTTWFAGTSALGGFWVGGGKVFDPDRFHIIAIDALGNGVSSSPSNSVAQPREQFPRFTIKDMVRSQHLLLTRELGFERVFAVSGASMGGMQALQWAVLYPDFMERVLAFTGTPRQTSYDLLLWKTELELLDSFRETPGGMEKAMRTIASIQTLEIRTPEHIVANVKRENVDQFMRTTADALKEKNPYDYASQLRAMIDHDIYRQFDGSVEKAAAAIRARLLIVVAMQDQMVHSSPARELARVAKAELLTLTSDCGHVATGCEGELVKRETWRFLK